MNSLNEDLQLKSRNFSTLLIQFKGLFSIVAGASKTKRKDHEEESEYVFIISVHSVYFGVFFFILIFVCFIYFCV